ncbi:MAG: adenosylcobinamide-GDP ribazoletransferase, partial [Actinomadura rubrobrunea]|nr:adenosylcobinamide-GDP ribazoletransferase [Actinomadura rubrobrunea]
APPGARAARGGAGAGRLALPWACRTGVPCARPGGLGALVAGTVGTREAVAVTVAVMAAAGGLGAWADGADGGVRAVAAVLLGLAAALLMLRHAVRRLGGITGDVLGALVELAATAALVVMAAH